MTLFEDFNFFFNCWFVRIRWLWDNNIDDLKKNNKNGENNDDDDDDNEDGDDDDNEDGDDDDNEDGDVTYSVRMTFSFKKRQSLFIFSPASCQASFSPFTFIYEMLTATK